jgi:UDP-N-acetylglucosamine 2-epimerase
MRKDMQIFEGQKLDIVTVAGNRPEVIKLSGLVHAFRNDKYLTNNYHHAFLYTGQHFSENMKKIFFEELDTEPDFDLRSNTSDIETLTRNVAAYLKATEPAYVIVYGDTNSTLAAALATRNLDCKLIHLEAGLRSFDLRMLEERNRLETDCLSDYLLAPTMLSKSFLMYEDANKDKEIFVTGNLIVDICRKFSQFCHGLPPLRKELNSIQPNEFILLTMHRKENIEDPSVLHNLFKKLGVLKRPVVFPVHPNTHSKILSFGVKIPENVKMIGPLGYLEFLNLLKNCLIVLTDSGGVQEEAVILRKPCITLRSTTERWETLLLKANRLYPLTPGNETSLEDTIDEMISVRITSNPYGENVTKTTLEALTTLVNDKSMVQQN